MKRHILIVFCYFVLTANPVFADTKSIKVDVGGVKINIQAQAAFHEISSLPFSEMPEMKKFVEFMTSPNNSLLAAFISEEDLGRIMKGEAPNFDRYMVLQVNRELEDKNISNAQFQQLANLIKEQHNTLLNKFKDKVGASIEDVGKKLSTEYDLSIKTQIGELVPLGIFLDKSDAVGFAILTKTNAEVEGEQYNYVGVDSFSILLTRGRLLRAYVHSTYETQNDINWVRSKSKEWVDSLLTSNYTTISYPDSPWEGRLKTAHCQQPIPEFAFVDDSNPSQDQVAQLCSCVWNKLGTREKETAQAISQGRVNEVSYFTLLTFSYRFGGAVRDCGGINL